MSETRTMSERTTWRYAMTREHVHGVDVYTIREVYVSPDGSLSWTEAACATNGSSWLDCANDLALMGRAAGGPVLDLTLDPPAWVSPRDFRKGA